MTDTIRYCIDTPNSWILSSNDLTISGWCFGLNGTEIKAVRVRVGAGILEATYELSRPDVADAYRDIGCTDQCGFAIEMRLQSGRQIVQIESVDQHGIVHSLVEYEASVPLAVLTAHIDTPKACRHLAGSVRFSGWCCQPDYRIASLTLHFGNISTECCYGIERPDVNVAYPQWVGSETSGFEAIITVPPAIGPVTLEAVLETGETCRFVSAMNFRIVRPPIWRRIGTCLARGVDFSRFALGSARTWKAHRGRWPMVFEFAGLARKAWLRYRAIPKPMPGSLQPPPGFILPEREEPYDAWLDVNRWNVRASRSLIGRLRTCPVMLPKISVVMPVYNPPIAYLELAIESVLRQVYDNWELCIADDASTDPQVRCTLEKYAARDSRISVVSRMDNGNISRATNSAAAAATGEFLVFLDNDDELTPSALAEVALYIADYPETDFLYTDDDKIDVDGKRFAPQFKPGWSPELLLSYMYCSHLVAVRRALFDKVGGMRIGFEGSQDYDFTLRATEHARNIGHIPLVLYHWRVLPGSTAVSGDAKPASIEAGRRAVQEALERRGIAGKAYQPDWAAKGGLGIFQHEFPDDGPSVAILIPTRNQLRVLRDCLESLRKTTYRNYRVVIIDNESDDTETVSFLKYCDYQVLRIPNHNGAFSFAYINNRAVECVKADYVLFLNNDTEIREPRWLSRMVGYAQIEGVGAVGARLLFPDGRIQHAGILHGLYHGMAGPAFKLSPSWDHGYLSYTMVTRNYSAVTAACLLTRRSLFLAMEGFDEERFSVAYNDVDYCYRLIDKGYRCVFTPGAELTHHEGYSRGFSDNPAEEAAFRKRYKDRIDPYYSPHLSLADEHFRIQPRRIALGRPRPIRALMAGFNMNLEGAPYSQYELTVRLKEMGAINPIVYCPEDGPLRELYEAKGIEVQVQTHPLRGAFTGGEFDTAIESFARYVQQTGAEMVYGNTLQTFYAIAAAERTGIPSIWNPRESEPWQTYFNSFGPEIASRALDCFRYPYRVIFVAEATKAVYAQLNSRHNFTVIHNGLDLTRLQQDSASWTRKAARGSLQMDDGEVMLLLLGTVCARKGQHDLTRALAQLPESLYSRLQCFIVGDRPSSYSHELAGLVALLPEALRSRVHVVPETVDTAKYYRAADVFICTSRIESYPRVIMEAMAYKLPIITTPCYGIREQVRDKVNGIFYNAGENAALASAIVALVTDSDLRQRLGKNATNVLMTRNTFSEMTRAYGDLFREASLCVPDGSCMKDRRATFHQKWNRSKISKDR